MCSECRGAYRCPMCDDEYTLDFVPMGEYDEEEPSIYEFYDDSNE